MMANPQGVWLFTRGSESVRLVREDMVAAGYHVAVRERGDVACLLNT
jgi:hypothetical protein